MDESKILQDVGSALIQKPVTFEIDILYPTLWERITKKKKRAYELKPLCLGKLIQVSKILLQIEVEDKEKEGMNLIASLALLHGEKLAEIVAICITPQREPTPGLINFLIDNLSIEEMKKAADVVLSQMNIEGFLLSIVTLKGTNILKSKTSLQPAEMIASGEPSEAL